MEAKHIPLKNDIIYKVFFIQKKSATWKGGIYILLPIKKAKMSVLGDWSDKQNLEKTLVPSQSC